MRTEICCLAAIAVAAVATVMIMFRQQPKAQTAAEADTVVLHDTVRIVKPRIIRQETVHHDTIFVRKDSTADTVLIPVTRYVYADSACRIAVEGYDVRLDTVEVFGTRQTVMRYVKPSPWGVAVTAGIGIDARGRVSPTVTVGISRTLWSFGRKTRK